MGTYFFETITAAMALSGASTRRIILAPVDGPGPLPYRAREPRPPSDRLVALKRPKVRLR